MNKLPAVIAIEGDVLRDTVISAKEMAAMNEARAAFRELRSILLLQIVPALGGYDHPISAQLELHIETIAFGSRNFLFPHRHSGAAYDAVNVGGGQ